MNLLKRLLHRHTWVYQDLGLGIFQKGKQNIKVAIEGQIMGCTCGRRMFFPDDKQLQPVDLDE